MNELKLQCLSFVFFVCMLIPIGFLNAQSIEALYSPTPGRLATGNLLDLAFDPDSSGLAYAVGNCGGFSRSTTDGDSWEDMDWENHIDFEQVVVFPGSEGKKVMAFTDFNYYISFDAADNWQEGSFYLPPEEGRITDAFALGKESAIFTTSFGRIYRTEDNGQSWELNPLQTGMLETQCLTFNGSQNGWLGDQNGRLYKTLDGGQNWTIHAQDTFSYFSLDMLNDSLGYSATSAGIFRLNGKELTPEHLTAPFILSYSAKVTAGSEKFFTLNTNRIITVMETREDGNNGWPMTFYSHFQSKRLHRRNDFLWACGQDKVIFTFHFNGMSDIYYASKPETEEFISDVFFYKKNECLATSTINSLFKVDKEQNNWTEVEIYGNDISRLNLVLSNGNVLSINNDRISILKDGDFRFHSMLPSTGIIAFEKDPFYDSTVYLLSSPDRLGLQLHKSTNNGLDWQLIYESSFRADKLLMPQKDVLFVQGGRRSNNLDRSIDGGQSWEVLLSGESIWTEDANFFDQDYGILALNDRLLITENGGLTFKDYPHAQVENIIFQSKQLVWATRFEGEGTHILKSKDGGQSWDNAFYLCNKVAKMKLDPFTGDLWFICTLGSVFTLRNSATQFYPDLEDSDFEIYPNPSSGFVQLNFPRDQEIPAERLEIYDTAGRLIENYFLDQHAINTFNWGHLHNGAYILRLVGNDFSHSRKFILQK